MKEPRWTRVTIISAMQTWEADHGEPPRAIEWSHRSDDWPSTIDVQRAFGTWNNAVVAAGYKPRRGREPGTHNISGPTQQATQLSRAFVLAEELQDCGHIEIDGMDVLDALASTSLVLVHSNANPAAVEHHLEMRHARR